jgi:hypothetical protein
MMKKIFISMLPAILLCGIWNKDVTAQTSTTSQPSTSFIGWDANTHEVAITAVIQQVVPSHSAGIPAGLHIMLGTPQGVVVASVGSYLPQEVRQALVVGKSVQVIGKVQVVHDQSYLFVRQLVMDGQPITVRNNRGSLVRSRSQERTYTQTLQDGGTK